MAIAVTPEPPRSRWDKLVDVGMIVALIVVLALFVYSMLDSYVL